ncbi:hypothetical protein MASR1M65_26900 [Saprospiraceae bacterium]
MLLDKGRVMEIGTHEALMEKEDGLYKELYSLQFEHAQPAG